MDHAEGALKLWKIIKYATNLARALNQWHFQKPETQVSGTQTVTSVYVLPSYVYLSTSI